MQTMFQNRRKRLGPSVLVIVDVFLLTLILGVVIHTQTAATLSDVTRVARQRAATLSDVTPVVRDQVDFWRARAGDLCVEPGPLPALPPTGENPMLHLARLRELPSFSREVWDVYKGCQEPRSLELPEDLLHFKVNRYDDFEADPEPAYRKIRNYLDQNLAARPQVFVLGHCDDTFTDEHNYQLSYRRALQIAKYIDDYLRNSKRLTPGRDFVLLPVGMGESQLPQREPEETLDDWRQRSRRIQVQLRGSGAMGLGHGERQ